MVKLSMCAPAMLYLILSIIALISMAIQKFGALSLLFKVIFVIIWTWFLNFLCKKGYKTISWILVILPFIIFILMILFAVKLVKMNNVKENFDMPTSSGQSSNSTNKSDDICTNNLFKKINKQNCNFNDASEQNECMDLVLDFSKNYCNIGNS